MRHLLNTLYVTTEDTYLTLDGENVVALKEGEILGRFPLHMLDNIVCFTYKGASPSLMGACGKRGIGLCFMTPNGRFLTRSCGESRGNVLLRKMQYRISDDEKQSCLIARNFVFGKVFNCRWSIERTTRDHPMRVDVEKLKRASATLADALPGIAAATELDTLRGLEGEASSVYFGVLDDMILNNKETFHYQGRSRRPPMDNVNALLSFTYTLLANDCASALEGAGLDAYVGFMHRDRPGRASLALDLMEELRGIVADRFVLTMINGRMLDAVDFIARENGSVLMTDECRKKVLKAWQDKKKEKITHPFIKEKIPWGLVPHIQALLLARHLRNDLDAYPPFLWK